MIEKKMFVILISKKKSIKINPPNPPAYRTGRLF